MCFLSALLSLSTLAGIAAQQPTIFVNITLYSDNSCTTLLSRPSEFPSNPIIINNIDCTLGWIETGNQWYYRAADCTNSSAIYNVSWNVGLPTCRSQTYFPGRGGATGGCTLGGFGSPSRYVKLTCSLTSVPSPSSTSISLPPSTTYPNLCDAGTYNPSQGSAFKSACVPCDAGSLCSQKGLFSTSEIPLRKLLPRQLASDSLSSRHLLSGTTPEPGVFPPNALSRKLFPTRPMQVKRPHLHAVRARRRRPALQAPPIPPQPSQPRPPPPIRS